VRSHAEREQVETKIEQRSKTDRHFVCKPKGIRRETNWVSACKPLFSEATSCSTDVSDVSASYITRVDEKAARSGGNAL
jgi:hypothetical protein